ncbi:MAG: thioesterase family protein [Saprospiraceae bacterium]|nr:thioesterase family protein [Saprospiraceae bacterium]
MRIKIKEFDHYIYSTRIKVRVTDLNYGNHLSNEMMLTYAQQARVDFLNSLGYGELTLAGKGIIMTDAAVIYKAEVHAADQLKIELTIDELTNIGFDIYYKISNITSETVVANVKTGILCFDYNTKKISPIPEEVVKKLKPLIT